ncbi:MAG TPA: FG-GAP-like repeat-containing protein, partial [Candidatus Krumholzibacteria bacterium]|nr:FG-GAP-like repeat-containing protein [Candidatus Krumholzibacteria bacterium]
LAAVQAVDGGAPELAVCDLMAGEIRILAGGPGGFTDFAATELPAGVRSLAAGDVDGDGHGDLVLLLRTAPEVRVLYGAGDGTFPAEAAVAFDPILARLVVMDLDLDGRLDLVGADAINRVATSLNLDGRSFAAPDWQSAGSGSRMLTTGDLDGDGDEDLVVVSPGDQTLTLLHNTGQGALVRLVGSIALSVRPTSAQVGDVNQDGYADIVVNFPENDTIGVVYGLPGGAYTPAVPFAASGDVAFLSLGDFNADEVPDILTLDAALHLGLVMLNIERGEVAADPAVLAAACNGGTTTVTVRPPAGTAWRLERVDGRGVTLLAVDGIALAGSLAPAPDGWTWTDEAAADGAVFRLQLREGAALRVEATDPVDCGRAPAGPLAWEREPWPNPGNPSVQARFVLARPGRVQVTVYDLRGQRVAELWDGELAAGVHDVHWDGRSGGGAAGAGVYLLRVTSERGSLAGKVLLLK